MVLALEADGAGGDHRAVDEGGGGFGQVGGGEFVERVRAEGGGEVYGFAQVPGGDVPAEDAGGFGVGYGVSGGKRVGKLLFVRPGGMIGSTYLRSP